MNKEASPGFGALIISLDFELYWGVRDVLASDQGYKKNLSGEHAAVPKILDLFREFEIGATWATVGFLFAESRQELEAFMPRSLPRYQEEILSPYLDRFEEFAGNGSIHYAPELIDSIRRTPLQEIGTHTFSHYYCLERGQDAESFSADIESALAIAKAHGIDIRSIVFPRNQHNPEYDEVLVKHGISCYRGNQPSWMYDFNAGTQSNPIHRAARLADSYANISGMNTYQWRQAKQGELVNIAASAFLRPVTRHRSLFNDLQFRRLAACLRYAAENRQFFHLWWHPHNFGLNTQENIAFLRRLFENFSELREKHGIRSLSMAASCRPCASLFKLMGDGPKILMLCSDGPSTRAIYNALKREYGDLTVVMEGPVSRLEMARRRLKKLGYIKVAGQIAFSGIVVPLLTRLSTRRITQIEEEFGLRKDLDDERLTRVESVNSPRVISILQALQPDVVVVNGTRIINPDVLGSTKATFINTHAGITPRYRGVHGGYWALFEGRADLVGTTVHLVDKGIDTGGIIEQAFFKVTEHDNFVTYPYLHTAHGIPPLLRAISNTIRDGKPAMQESNGLESHLRYHPTIWEYLCKRIREGVK